MTEKVFNSSEVVRGNTCIDDKDDVNAIVDDVELTDENNMTDSIALIPLKKIKLRDDQFKKIITEKLEMKKLIVKGVTTHRDFADGSIVRSDVLVEPVESSLVCKTNFGFEFCVVLACPVDQKEKG